MAEETNAHVAEKEDVNDDVTEREEVTDDVIENEGLNNDVAEKEEANDDILLYPNWVRSIEENDGSSFECYKNSKTGQTFYSREDLTRYLTYVTEVRPVLGDKGFCPDGLPKEHKGKKGKAVRRRSAAVAGVKQKKSLSGKVKSSLSGKVKKSLSGKVKSSLSGKVKKSFSGKVKKLQLG